MCHLACLSLFSDKQGSFIEHGSQQVHSDEYYGLTRMDSGVADFGLVEKDVLCAIMTITAGVDSGSL